MRRKGFTLIELLVVIAIIGVLAAISVVTLQYTKNRANIAKAKNDLAILQKVLITAQQEQSRPLTQITGSGCTDCSCRTGTDMKNTTGDCFIDWQSAIQLIETSTNGLAAGAAQRFLRDPWGSPYGFDENEREFSQNDCRQDTFRSFGPDGIHNTVDDVSLEDGAYRSSLPHSTPCP